MEQIFYTDYVLVPNEKIVHILFTIDIICYHHNSIKDLFICKLKGIFFCLSSSFHTISTSLYFSFFQIKILILIFGL